MAKAIWNIFLEYLVKLFGSIKDRFAGISSGGGAVRTAAGSGALAGFIRLISSEWARKLEERGVTGLFKRYWHIAVPSVALVITLSINVAVLSAGNSTRVAPDTYTISCLKCKAHHEIDRSYYTPQFSTTGESDVIRDSHHKNCPQCQNAYEIAAVVHCPKCNKEFVMGKPFAVDFPANAAQRAHFCPHGH